jgi:hypothetical protein
MEGNMDTEQEAVIRRHNKAAEDRLIKGFAPCAKVMLEFTCGQCKRKVKRRVSRSIRRKVKYCGKKCSLAAQNERRRG